MPLRKCPDCGSAISTEAPACPKCGRPMRRPASSTSNNKTRTGKFGEEFRANPKAKSLDMLKLVLMVLGGFFVFFIVVGVCATRERTSKPTQVSAISPARSRPKAAVPPKVISTSTSIDVARQNPPPDQAAPPSTGSQPAKRPAATGYISDSYIQMHAALTDSSKTDLQKDQLWESKYHNKPVRWTGQVNHIDSPSGGEIHVGIQHDPSTITYDVLLVFPASEASNLLNVNKGSIITYTGILTERGGVFTSYTVSNPKIEQIHQ